MIEQILRYSIAAIGPIGVAGAQFVLSIVLLHQLDAIDFGRFAFLLVILQFSWGIWGALFCAPLPALLTINEIDKQNTAIRCLTSVNGVAALLAFFVLLVVALVTGANFISAVFYGAAGSFALLRLYARARFYATGNMGGPVFSDLVYAIGLLIGTYIVSITVSNQLEGVFALLLASSVLAMIPFGKRYLCDQFMRNPFQEFVNYRAIWKQHARWSILGVMTTEATANAHVYVVTLAVGPSAYAPLAASALLIRPIQVAMNALSEFERAQIARKIGRCEFEMVWSSVRFFRIALFCVWGLTVTASAAILFFIPRIVFPASYEIPTLVIGTALWMIVAVIRLARTPDSVLLQAGGSSKF